MMMAADMPGYFTVGKTGNYDLWDSDNFMRHSYRRCRENNLGWTFSPNIRMAGIVTGMVLMKALENRPQGNKETLKGELHNA